jgi:hypothetical protein
MDGSPRQNASTIADSGWFENPIVVVLFVPSSAFKPPSAAPSWGKSVLQPTALAGCGEWGSELSEKEDLPMKRRL